MPLIALAPILLLFALLIGAHWRAATAGAAAALAAAVLALGVFGYDATGAGPLAALLGPLLEASFIAATIVWIIFPALCIHEYQSQTGANALFGRWLAGLSDDPRMTALLVAWFFSLFLEGAAGFGTPIALAAPLLVAAGFTPMTALTLALLGNAAGVSFGAIGTPMVPLLASGVFDPEALSLLVISLHAAVGWTMAALVYRLAGVGVPSAGRAAAVARVGGAALLFFVPAGLLAWTLGPELPTLGGAMVGGTLFVLAKRRRPSKPVPNAPSNRALLDAALPYLLVVGLILMTRLVIPLAEVLRGMSFDWEAYGQFGGTVAPLHHPGTMLFLGFLAAGLTQRGGRALIPQSIGRAAARLPTVALALLTVLLLARLMVHSGMISLLAASTARALGGAWPLLAPAAGALGSFITGSASSSNILFGDFQFAAARDAGLSPMLMTAAQAFGAAAGNLIAPHNIVAGAATVGLIGREGEIMRRMLPPCLLYVAAGGVLVLLLSFRLG